MSPWTIIGWIVVAVLSAGIGIPISIVAVKLSAIPWRLAAARMRYLRTRNDAPAEGQRWMQDDRMIFVKRITDEGRIALGMGSLGRGASWSDSPEEWRERVRSRKLWRVR